jgi:replicative DNA helicase
MTIAATPHSHAHLYATLGWPVIPIVPGEKRPATLHGLNDATTDPDLIDTWWTRWPNHSIGIATGPAANLFVVDIDIADGKPGEETIRELETRYGKLPPTVEAITGSGGRHLLFAWPATHNIRNSASGRLGPGLDIRGAGGYIVAPPSIHANGTFYAWKPSHEPWTITPAEAPVWFLDLAAPPDTPTSSSSSSGDSDSAAAHYNASTTWPDLLTADGWTLTQTLPDGEQRWTRPGKNGHEGHSATVGHDGRDCLKVFTSSVAGLDADIAYSRFGYTAAVHHNGDRSALARTIRATIPTVAPDVDLDWTGIDDWTGDPPEVAPPIDPDTPWADPEPFDVTEAGPVFPIHTLPAWIADQVRAVSDTYQVPADLPAIVAIGALSAVATSHLKLQLPNSNWVEHVNLYLVAAMTAGSGKSPVFKVMIAPVVELEKHLTKVMRSTIREAEIKQDLLGRRVKAATEAAAKADTDSFLARLNDVARLQAELDDLEVPPPPRMIAEDSTPEALVQLLGSHAGRMALLSSEGGVFDMMGGQYAEKGRGANLAVYLQGWSGDSVRRDRKGESVVIDEALLTICSTTQPTVIGRLGSNPDLTGRGVAARFMYSIPASITGRRDRAKVYTTLDDTIRTTYRDRLFDLGARFNTWQTPATVTLDEPARARFEAWDTDIERRCRPGADLADHAEWVQKLRSSVLRVTALLHVADGRNHQDLIDVATLERAFTIGDYWIANTRIVADLWATTPIDDASKAIIDWAVTEGHSEFSASDLQKEMRRRFDRIGDVVEPLTMLAETGWVRANEGLPIKVGVRGKPSPRFAVHPHAAEHRKTGEIRAIRAATPEKGPSFAPSEFRVGGFYIPPPTTPHSPPPSMRECANEHNSPETPPWL